MRPAVDTVGFRPGLLVHHPQTQMCLKNPLPLLDGPGPIYGMSLEGPGPLKADIPSYTLILLIQLWPETLDVYIWPSDCCVPS